MRITALNLQKTNVGSRLIHLFVAAVFAITSVSGSLLTGAVKAYAESGIQTISGGLRIDGIDLPVNGNDATITFSGDGIMASSGFTTNQYGQQEFHASGPAGIYNQVKLTNFYGMSLTNGVPIDTTAGDVQVSLNMALNTKFFVRVVNAEGDPIPNVPVVFAPTGNGTTILGGAEPTAIVSDVAGIDNYPTSALASASRTDAQGYAAILPTFVGLEYFPACAFFEGGQTICSDGRFIDDGTQPGIVIQNTSVHSDPVAAPVLTAASPTRNAPSLSWTAPTGLRSAVSYYKIYRNNSLVGTTSDRAFNDGTVQYVDGMYSYGNVYRYSVVPVDMNGHDIVGSNVVEVVYDSMPVSVVTVGQPYGWVNRSVTLEFQCTDNLSGVQSCPGPIEFTKEGAHQGQLVSAYDNAGNQTDVWAGDVNIDRTAPQISYKLSQTPTTSGWNNQDVTVTFDCSDDLSGVQSCPQPVTVRGETSGTVVSGAVSDLAGNMSQTSVTIKIDRTSPTTSKVVFKKTQVITILTPTIQAFADVQDGFSGVESAEYFIDVDPGAGHGQPMGISQGQATAQISPTKLSLGYHWIHIRSKDAAGNWSVTASKAFLFL